MRVDGHAGQVREVEGNEADDNLAVGDVFVGDRVEVPVEDGHLQDEEGRPERGERQPHGEETGRPQGLEAGAVGGRRQDVVSVEQGGGQANVRFPRFSEFCLLGVLTEVFKVRQNDQLQDKIHFKIAFKM